MQTSSNVSLWPCCICHASILSFPITFVFCLCLDIHIAITMTLWWYTDSHLDYDRWVTGGGIVRYDVPCQIIISNVIRITKPMQRSGGREGWGIFNNNKQQTPTALTPSCALLPGAWGKQQLVSLADKRPESYVKVVPRLDIVLH